MFTCAKCYEQAFYIKALMVNDGMPALWIALNPSDLKSTLVLTLAGVRIPDSDGQNQSASRLHSATATMISVAVAQFFEATCSAVYENLLQDGLADSGLLGPISTCFRTVGTNGRGMLHLHCLIWLEGFFHFAALRKRLSSKPSHSDPMTQSMTQYLDGIIKCCIEPDGTALSRGLEAPPASLEEIDAKFAADRNHSASTCQMHSTSHNATCFKYGAAASQKCRFNLPRPMVGQTHVSNFGVIEICRNNSWVNSWNAAFASLIRSNHDITFNPSTIEAMA